MAGFYPDAPGPRMALDRDGSAIVRLDATGSTLEHEFTQPQKVTVNNEASDYYVWFSGNNGTARHVCVLFPEPRNVFGMLVRFVAERGGGLAGNLEWSTDTTTGADGTWTDSGINVTTIGAPGARSSYLREDITALSLSGVSGLRVRIQQTTTHGGGNQNRLSAVHVYGAAASPTDSRLRLWHPTVDRPLEEAGDGGYFDYGDIPRGIAGFDPDRMFRVKNNSSTETANAVTLTTEILTDGSPSVLTQYEFDVAGGSGFANPNSDIGNLAPGALSPVITLRRITDSSAPLGLFWPRLVADAGSWT